MSTAPLFTTNVVRARARRPRPTATHVPQTEARESQVPHRHVSPEVALPETQPQLHSNPTFPEQPQSENVRPETPTRNARYEVRRAIGRSLKSMGSPSQATPEHSVLILRMGYTQYLQKCLADGLLWKGSSLASEYAALGWVFSRRIPAQSSDYQAIPLPPWSPGDIPLCLYGARGPRPVAAIHVTITDCRVYYTPMPATTPLYVSGVIAHYAVPMSILDEMERGAVGYNTFVHRLESPCFSSHSNLAVQMGPSPLVLQPKRPLATVEVEADDWLAVQLEATHYGSTTLCCVPYMSPYTHVGGSLCKDTTCVSRLEFPDYRPVTSSEATTETRVLVPRLRVLCVVGDGSDRSSA